MNACTSPLNVNTPFENIYDDIFQKQSAKERGKKNKQTKNKHFFKVYLLVG